MHCVVKTETMKRLLVLGVFLYALTSEAQITPFKFKNDFDASQSDLFSHPTSIGSGTNTYANDSVIEMKKEDLIRKFWFDDKFDSTYLELSALYAVLYDTSIYEINAHFDKRLDTLKNNWSPTTDHKKFQRALKDLNNQREAALKDNESYLDYSKEYHYYARNLDFFRFFPVRNDIDAQLFYNSTVSENKFQFAENTNFVFNTGGQRVSGMTELYADYFGPFRLSFGALLSNGKVSTFTDSLGNVYVDSAGIQKDAVQELLGGGGNAIFQLSYPLFNYTGPLEHFNIKGTVSPKFSFDLPSLGNSLTNSTSNTDIGADLALFYAGATNVLTLYTYNRFGYVLGTSGFYDHLLLRKDRDGFFMTQLTFGVAIKSVFRVSYSIYLGNDYVRSNFQPMVSFSIIPQ